MGTSVLCSGSNFFLDELVHCCQLPVLRHLVATRLAAQPKLQQGSNKENHVRLKQPSRCASNRTRFNQAVSYPLQDFGPWYALHLQEG